MITPNYCTLSRTASYIFFVNYGIFEYDQQCHIDIIFSNIHYNYGTSLRSSIFAYSRRPKNTLHGVKQFHFSIIQFTTYSGIVSFTFLLREIIFAFSGTCSIMKYGSTANNDHLHRVLMNIDRCYYKD